MIIKTKEEKYKIWGFYTEFRANPILNQLYSTPQHRTSNTFRHVCLVTKKSVTKAIKKGYDIDYYSLIRGAFLHDLFFYNWREHKLASLLHLWKHPRYAYENAISQFQLTDIEKDIILNHMWPITITKFPKTKEGRLVMMMDKKVTLYEFFSRKKSNIVFDLDGTLVNTLPDLNNSVNYALAKNGFEPRDLEHTRHAVGNGMPLFVRRSLPENVSEEAFQKTLSDFLEHYSVHYLDESKPYDGILHVLQRLRRHGYKLAVTTNKNLDVAKKIIDKFFPNLFLAVVGSEKNIKPKPDRQMMRVVKSKLKLKTFRNITYIGDSETDYKFASNCNVSCILVGYGFRTRDELTPYKQKVPIAMFPDEILDYFKK